MLDKLIGKWVHNTSENVVNPIRFSLFYLVYIAACEIITRNFDIDGIAYFVLLLIGLTIYGYLIRYVFIMISHAGTGQKSTNEAVFNIVLSVITGIIFFAINYFYLSIIDQGSFSGYLGHNPVSRLIGCIYYSVITFSTIGYGDITPVSNLARMIVVGEVLYSMFILVLVISSFSALKEAMGDPENDHMRTRFSKQRSIGKSPNKIE